MTLEELKVVISAETKGLEKAVKGVKSTLNGLTKTVQHTTSNLTRQFDRLGKSMTNSFKSLLKFAGLGAAIAGLVKIGKSAVQVASDLEEIQNVVEVVFGESTKEINQWAKSTLKSFGMTESEAKNVASTFKAMSNGMGIADDAGRAMSMRLAELSADLASFRNTTTNVASTALAGVFTGETEALKKFGVVMTQANLQAFALSKGITKSYNAMSQAEKVALRYQYVMQATADAQGDFARSSGSWANQMRVLKGQWTEFLGVIGQGIKQVLTPLISVMNNILASVITVTKAVLSLLGIDFSISEGKVSSLGGGVDDIAEGLDDATGSAKALNKEIAGFDELETLSSKSGLGGLAEDIASAASDLQIEQPEIKMDETGQKMFDSFKQAMEELESWFEKKLDPWMSEQSIKIANWLNKLFGDKDSWGQAGQTVGAGLNTIIHAVDNFFTQLDGYNVGSAFGTFFNNLTAKIDWQSLGHGWGEKLKTGMDIAIGFLETYNFQALGESIARAFDSADWTGIGKRLATLISDMLLAAMDFAIGLATGHWGQNASNFIDGWAEGWKGEELKTKFVEKFKPAMESAWQEIWDSLSANSVIGDLITSIDKLKDAIDSLIKVALALTILISVAKAADALAVAFEAVAHGSQVMNYAMSLGATRYQGFIVALTEGNAVSMALGKTLINVGKYFASFGATFTATYQAFMTQNSLMLAQSGALKAALLKLTGGFKALWAVIAAHPIVAIVAAIGTIVAAVIHLWKTNEDFRNSVIDLYENSIKPVVEGILTVVGGLVESLKPIFSILWSGIKGSWDKIARVIGEALIVIGNVVTVVTSVVGAILGTVSIGVDAILKVLGGVLEFLKTGFTQGWKTAFENAGKIFKDVFEGIKNTAKTVMNAVIKILNNGLIKALNRIQIPEWVPGVGGKGFHIPTIPYLAKGGVIDNPTVAMLGEYQGARQNPEIAAPESMIRDIVVNANGEMVNAFYQMATQIINAIDNVDMSVQIGDETIAKSAKRGSDQYFKMTGKPMFAY